MSFQALANCKGAGMIWRISGTHIKCGWEQTLTWDEDAPVSARWRLKTSPGDQKPLCFAHGAGVAVSSKISSREEGIWMKWRQAEKLSSLSVCREGEEWGGGSLHRAGCGGCFTNPCSDGSVGAVVLLYLFHFTLCCRQITGHRCSTGYIRTKFVPSALCWPAMFSSYVIFFFFNFYFGVCWLIFGYVHLC